MRGPAARVAHARRLIGVKQYSGWCEKFVRECFGFPARYPSATLAWNATKRRHSDITRAPAGVPIFWELHRANKNHGLGHVALSVGNGNCITTSYGPGGAIAQVGIAKLTADWGMSIRGWTEDYHGKTVWKGQAPGNGRHVVADRTIRARLAKVRGIKRPARLSTWIGRYQRRQRYAPGLIADKVWGQATEGHYQWTRVIQQTMKRWKGSRDTAVDGDFYGATTSRVREIQRRNMGGAYKGALDGIPGPVFCRTLGIETHPGL